MLLKWVCCSVHERHFALGQFRKSKKKFCPHVQVIGKVTVKTSWEQLYLPPGQVLKTVAPSILTALRKWKQLKALEPIRSIPKWREEQRSRNSNIEISSFGKLYIICTFFPRNSFLITLFHSGLNLLGKHSYSGNCWPNFSRADEVTFFQKNREPLQDTYWSILP